jgi:mannose-6-phosphate isomerase-like protein (cupin superfamily)
MAVPLLEARASPRDCLFEVSDYVISGANPEMFVEGGREDDMTPECIDTHALAALVHERYANTPVTQVNDHVVRISVMTEPFYWHVHPDTDEAFLVLEGALLIEFEEGAVELTVGQMLTVRAGQAHRTRPVGSRSVNLTFERADATTVRIEEPRGRAE